MFEKKSHSKNQLGSTIREVVFGVEDGMVSTLGAITGIAIGSQDLFTVILAGVVIISVESISMGIGSYLANRTEQDVNQRLITLKRAEIEKNTEGNKAELKNLFMRDGWPEQLADEMSVTAQQDKGLILKEVAYRELHTSDEAEAVPLKNAVFMYFSYIAGGIVPLFAYLLFPVSKAMPISIIITLLGLFLLGVATTKYTKGFWLKEGTRILIFGTIALMVGFVVGDLAARFN